MPLFPLLDALRIPPAPPLAAITFANPAWAWAAAVAGAAALVLLVVGYRRSPLPAGAKRAAFALKALGLLFLALALLEPVRVEERPKAQANDLAVVAANSASLEVPLSPGTPPPAAALREALAAPSDGEPYTPPPWMERLAETYRLQTFLFDRGLRRGGDFSELDFSGMGTRLAGALESLGRRYENRPLAGAVVFTDGNATDEAELEDFIARLEEDGSEGYPPLFPVLLSEDDPDAFDLALGPVQVETSSFEDAPVGLTVEARLRGEMEDPAEIVVTDEQGEELARREVVFPPGEGDRSATARLRLAVLPPGISFLQVEIRQRTGEQDDPDDQEAPDDQGDREESTAGDGAGEPLPAAREELTERNNARRIVVNPGAGPYRVLYVAGRPNWEYKFLRRSLAKDAEMDLAALVRIAKREPKFEWRGREGESSNPLFRGFQRDLPEDIYRYDEPVFIRLNVASDEELRDGFPKTEEALFPHFRAIVLDNVEAEFFTLEQQELLENFVSRRGGTILMLGGQESFHAGGWANTPVARLLPVYLEGHQGDPVREATYNLTREGWLEPWLRHRGSDEEEGLRLALMPPFYVVNPIRAIKPGAALLATVTDPDGAVHPALVTQRYGEGRSAALAVGDIWRWGMRGAEQREEMEKFWRQLLRWSVVDVPERVSLDSMPLESGGLPLTRFTARVLDERFDPQDDATVFFNLAETDGTSVRLAGEPSLEDPGLFTIDYLATGEAGLRVEATAQDAEGEIFGRAETALAFNPEAEEFARFGPRPDLLGRLAEATGGRLLTLDRLGELPGLLQEQESPVPEITTRPLWHAPWLFLLALGCFLGEWTIRRRHGIL